MRYRFVVVALSISAFASFAQELPAPVTSVEGITEYRLDNGLRVLLFPDRSKATVTVNVTYLVGSRHEGRGEAGMAHLLEHMVFKGTPTFPNIWGALEDHGADFNGSTWVDRTNYYETLPASDENLDFALSMEADRMINSNISAEELAKEMTVVRNEFEMGENSPFNVLTERISSAAFLWHNYGKSTIGNRSDIERVPAESLRAFYEKYYQPDNAVLVVAGKFEPEATLELIVTYFGAIPKPARVLEATYTEEPVQDGPRFVTVKRVGDVALAAVTYHVPAGSHEEYPAVQVLQEVLTSQPAGRLYQALVETGKAASVGGMAFPWAEPGLMMSVVEFPDEQDPKAILDETEKVAENLRDEPITEEEVERIKTRLLKNIKLALADSGSVGIELSEWAALGDWRMFFIHRDRLKEVTAEQVQRAADKYLIESNRTAGLFIPTKEIVRAEIPDTPVVASLVEGYEGTEDIVTGEVFAATTENIDARTERYTIGEDLDVALLAKETRGAAVQISMQLHFGTAESLAPHRAALEMAAALLMRGTKRLDYQALRDEIDQQQSQISVTAAKGGVSGSIVSDRDHIGAALSLLAEVLKTPRFDAEQFEIIKKERVTDLENQLSDPQGLGFSALSRSINPWPKESIHYVPTLQEQIDELNALTLDSVKEAYAKFYGAGHGEIALVGDFDVDAVKAALNTEFAEWKSSEPYARIEKEFRANEAVDLAIDTPDKQMAIVGMAGTIKITDGDPDYPALTFASYILGQSAKSRLMTKLRHEGGLSYGAGAFMQADDKNSHAGLIAYAICAPQNSAKALDVMKEQIALWVSDGLTDEEIAEGKSSYKLTMDNQLADDQFVVTTLAEYLDADRTFAFLQARIDMIQALTKDEIAAVVKKHFGDVRFMTMNAGDQSKAVEAAAGTD